MGSIFPDHSRSENGFSSHFNIDGFRSFDVVGLNTQENAYPSSMKEDILLVAWLIVLLKTREGSNVCYEWAYSHGSSGEKPEKRSFAMDKVITGLKDTVGQVSEAVSASIQKAGCAEKSGPISILLSTSSLTETSEEAQDEGLLHLEVRFVNGHILQIRPILSNKNMPDYSVARHMERLVDNVRLCISKPDASIEESLGVTARDLDDIWSWNHELPPYQDYCMHEKFSEQARRLPDKVAISSWDGDLTYGQIEEYSNFLANSLTDAGVQLHDFLPVCFEKSKWTIVAVLAAMKSGATFVLMDPTLPLARLQNMAKQVGAKTMVTSRDQRELSTSILPEGKILTVEAETFTNIPASLGDLAPVPASALMYIIFTSGSTGTPKGVKVSHGAYSSSALPRARAVGYTEDSRVLDFASYAFDVSIDSMLLTLCNGGTLCIPSDEDRLNDINEVIRSMRVNYAGITPSVARILDADVIASLSALGLGGEAASARDVTHWGQDTRIVIGYGPCECTIGCTVNSDTATGRDYISIGTGNGSAIWIVDPNDHEVLMPVGAVGELLVEGPIVGQGYLNDPEKTAAAFIEDPSWLVAGHKPYDGRKGRLYKTGDLGKYDPDGSGGIVFAGRKDTQVKLRGQRVELGEIESQLIARLPSSANVIAEVITPQGSGGQPTLVAFVAFQSAKGQEQDEISAAKLPAEQREALSNADAEITKVLPRYMVPTAYIPVNYIPALISGKTDRKRLRQFGTTVELRELEQETTSTPSRPLNNLELRLRQSWGTILKLDPENIRLEDNFFALGGDSLSAMKLVSVCRADGLDISVINTFANPKLVAMAGVVQICKTEAQVEIQPFSLISQDPQSACLEASRACESDLTAIKDIYPCTPTQESLFTFSLKSTKVYVAQRVARIPSDMDVDALKKAWEQVVAASPILRTRLAQLQEPGLQQVVVNDGITWIHSTDLAKYLEEDRKEKMELGQSLARYAIVDNLSDGTRSMVWTVHHVLYDGWSEPIVLKQVSDALQNRLTGPLSQMRDFVKYVRDTDEVAMQEFWRRELHDAVGPQFPHLPSRDFLPTPDGMIEHQINIETSAGWPFTMATLIRGAWALVASQYTGSDDVVFGETLTGRDISLAGVEDIVGPLIATVPVRIRVDRTTSVESYLQTVQQGMLARTPYQHMGMQNIRKVSKDAQYACEAGTGLVIQPEPDYVGSELGFEIGDVVREALHFNPYPLMIACGIRDGGFRICASFDTSLINASQMKRVLTQLEMACSQLLKGLTKSINEVSCLPEEELNQIWHWNQAAPLALDESSKGLRAGANIRPGSAYPPAVVPWVCDLRNPSLLAPIGCVGELWLEGSFLPGETVQAPEWLQAGSSTCAGRKGQVQATGDLVQLLEDNSLLFVGRREGVLPVQGHSVNISELEGHFAKYLTPSTRAAVAVCQPSTDATEQALLIFVEQQTSNANSLELIPAPHTLTYNISDSERSEAIISATIRIDTAAALRKLDKFIQDALPSYMNPYTYVVVDHIPVRAGLADHAKLNQLASKIPRDVLNQLRGGFKEAWTKTAALTNLTDSESILQSSWSKILRLSPEQIDVDDNFFRLGGDSVLAMKLVSNLRGQGHGLSVADIFQNMRLGDAAKVLRVNQVSTEKPKPYQPFSTLALSNKESFLSEVVQPKLSSQDWIVRDASHVTDSQAMDIRGTVTSPRTSLQFNLLYFDKGIDQGQLLRAWAQLVKTHDILRTVFIEHDSKYLQVVIDNLDVTVVKRQADKVLEQYVQDLCAQEIEAPFELGSSFSRIYHVEGNDGRECFAIGLSHAQYDGVSLPMLLRDLETLYTGKAVNASEPFISYVAQSYNERVQSKAVTYWRTVLDGSSLSVLEGSLGQPSDRSIFHTKSVNISKRPEGITTASLLTAAWAVVLARRLQKSDVTFGSVTSGRNIDLANVEKVMGPCYQITPVRVSLKSQRTALELLQLVQQQSANSAAHDFLGFERISKQCAQWSSEQQFFDSIVHHQDHEDFDTMPFAEGTCRVDVANPHGDAAHPFKAVSFVQNGQASVGMVGSEKDVELVDQCLDQLASTIEELVDGSKQLDF